MGKAKRFLYFYHRFIIKELEISTTEIGKGAVFRDRTALVLPVHLVIDYGQLEARRISTNGQAEEYHLHYWQRKDEQHDPRIIKCYFCSSDSCLWGIRLLLIIKV